MDKNTIINELKRYYGFEKDIDFAKFLNISPQVLSNWKARNTFNYKKIYTKCNEINPEWLINGEGSMLKVTYSLGADSYSHVGELSDKDGIPLYDLTASKSLKNICQKEKYVILDYLNIPHINCDGAIYMQDDSMLPILNHGDIVTFQNTTLDQIYWGKIYLIDFKMKNERRTVIKYVQKSDLGIKYIRLVSGNPQYGDKDVHINNVEIIAMVSAGIKYY